MVSKGINENSWFNSITLNRVENKETVYSIKEELCHETNLPNKSPMNDCEMDQNGDAVRLPPDMDYLGQFPEYSIVKMILKCVYCNQSLIPQSLKGHMDRCPRNPNLGKGLDSGIEENDSSSIGPDGKPVSKASNYSNKIKRPASDIDIDDYGYFHTSEDSVLVTCKYCGFKVKRSCLISHLEKCHASTIASNNPGGSFLVRSSFAQSEFDTSSSNSSPTWDNDKNMFDSCFSSSSSNSVNIVRLNNKKPFPPDLPFLPGGCRIPQESACVKQELPTLISQPVSSPPQPKLTSSPQPIVSPDTTMLHEETKLNVESPSLITTDTLFECQPYFETVQPSTSFQESSQNMGKSKLSKLIIRRVAPQNSNDVRRISVEKDQKNNSRTDNLRCFFVKEEDRRPENIKASKQQMKKKFCDSKNKGNEVSEQNEYLRASEQQIAFLTGRIESLNRQIETLTGQVGPLRLENEKYKAEIRNLRCRVEELENNTSALIEQRKQRERNEKKIEELQKNWDREKFHFTQHLEELQTELSDYKNSSTIEKQKLTILNAYLERKAGLQETLLENIRKEKEILERHIPPGVHYRVMNELADIQTRRSVIYTTLLNSSIDCHLNNPPTITFPNIAVEQLPLNSRQVLDMNAYLPLDSPSTEMSPGGNGQLIDAFNESKIQYQAFSVEVPDMKERMNINEDDNKRNEGNDIS